MEGSSIALGAFTCITCRVAFTDADMQRAHYKADWHRYNLKRKVADMPPVTAENFYDRVMTQRTQANEANKTDVSTRCEICNKHFGSKSQFDNHVQSKKHKDAESKEQKKSVDERMNKKNRETNETVKNVADKEATNIELKANLDKEASSKPSTSSEVQMTEDDNESCEDWDGDALGLEECLFCPKVCSSLENNIDHMTRIHSFFIPDLDYIKDLEGLMTYLGEKVGEGHICLWCNEKSKTFLTTQAVRKHMGDKGHCKMLFEGEAVFEYSDFYDYRSSYPDYDPEAEVGEMDDASEGAAPSGLIDDEGYQLVLPSGSTIGHRTLQRYYRQNLKPEKTQHSSALRKALAQYKSLGWTGCTGLDAKKRAKDINAIQRMKKRHHIALSLKANKFQPYLRPQVVF